MANQEAVGTVLLTQEQIWQRTKELGKEISRDYAGEEVILIGTLKGAVMFMADLMKNIALDIQIDFISASSYGSGTISSGSVKIKKDIEIDITGKNVIIIEDIIDTGNTLKYLKEYFLSKNPKSLKICTLLDKPSRRQADVTGDYIGFTVEDLFIIGYGLDFDQKYRNLPYISYLEG
ncbi:hypoxanthine phosphoribosyltransferase [Ihubacter sp. rT4E-8]|uniref:hypoxanthine phosphoribosyltransferase n=1 Tax=unclassified Ihubacter TaxID=2633299 RepID=UPI003C7B9DBA